MIDPVCAATRPHLKRFCECCARTRAHPESGVSYTALAPARGRGRSGWAGAELCARLFQQANERLTRVGLARDRLVERQPHRASARSTQHAHLETEPVDARHLRLFNLVQAGERATV